MQFTLVKDVAVSGIGVHGGLAATITIRPAAPDAGIAFVRSDLDNAITVPARYHLVSDTSLCTVLGVQPGPGVSTIEHLMAALRGLGISKALIEIDGPEMPIMDGSALPFVDAIRKVGVVAQARARRVIRVLEPVVVEDGRARVELLPFDRFRIEATIDFEDAVIGRQHFVYDEAETDFTSQVAPARTFGFMRDVEKVRAMGLARGAGLHNTVVVGEDAVLNEGGLRFSNEFARHKVLDSIGDLALAGFPLQALYKAERPGHRLNHAILTALFSRPGAWVLAEEAAPAAAGAAAARAKDARASEI